MAEGSLDDEAFEDQDSPGEGLSHGSNLSDEDVGLHVQDSDVDEYFVGSDDELEEADEQVHSSVADDEGPSDFDDDDWLPSDEEFEVECVKDPVPEVHPDDAKARVCSGVYML